MLRGDANVAIHAKPEVLSPRRVWQGTARGWGAPAGGRARGQAFDDEHLDMLSHLLDDFIRIPGTSIRFGLDGIIGFIPGIGDILGGLASSIIIIAAWMRGVPKVVVARMVLNVAIETAVGSVPVLGNFFDIGWRANRRNYALLTGVTAEPGERSGTKRRNATNWLFIAGVCVVLAALMVVPMLLLGWALLHVKPWLSGLTR